MFTDEIKERFKREVISPGEIIQGAQSDLFQDITLGKNVVETLDMTFLQDECLLGFFA